MHTFIYPSQDTYITNESGYDGNNFSLDSTLEIKAVNTSIQTEILYITQSVSGSTACDINLYSFSGSFYGNLDGYMPNSQVFVTGSGSFITNNFSGTIISSSVINYSGSVSGSFSGTVTGSFSGSVLYVPNKTSYMSGSIIDFTGDISSGSIYSGFGGIYSPYIGYVTDSVISRTLLQFDLSIISQSISNGNINNTGSLGYFLTLKNAQANEVPISYTIFAYPLTTPWYSGDGRYQLGGSNNGVSWDFTNYYSGSQWTSSGGDFVTSSQYSSYQVFSNTNSDIKMNIGKIANAWISGSLPNYGLILVTSLETSSMESNNRLKFFGTETNTIYYPYLDVSWNDSIYNTGSLLPAMYPYSVVLQNVKAQYKFGSVPRIDVYSSPVNPLKNFNKATQTNYYITSSFLPSPAYYMIKDNESEEVLINFDQGTILSCDGNINYFMLDTSGLPQERYYKILIKTTDSSGAVNIFDNNNIFKVVR